VFGTPAWEALAYGGGGQDIFFAGTGGDRLIDWVGNHNSNYVPFSQFGMPTVSRTLQPYLPEFLYALSKSDGADQTFIARYGGAASRNGEPFGELGIVLQHDDAWHQQVGPPFNEMPENLGGTSIDIMKTANVRPMGSPGTDPPASTLAPNVSLPSGANVNMPSGTNTPSATAVPLLVTGTPGTSVSYTFTAGTSTTSGSGTVTQGNFGANVNLSSFPDGTITVTATLSVGGVSTTTLTSTLIKSSTAPGAPTVALPAYANMFNQTFYLLGISGDVGSIANVLITDGTIGIPRVANGMDVIGSTGTVFIPIDVSFLADGPLSVSVTLTNSAGNSTATTLTITKATVPPTIGYSMMTLPTNNGSYDVGTTITFSFSATTFIVGIASLTATLDSTTALTSGQAINVDNLNAGTHTIVITAIDLAGNISATTITFQVHATVGGMINAVNQGAAAGLITSTTQQKLVAMLNAIQIYLNSGNIAGAKSQLNAYISYVQTQSGTTINASYASRLVNWAQDLLSRL
jgi:hypothetical protein